MRKAVPDISCYLYDTSGLNDSQRFGLLYYIYTQAHRIPRVLVPVRGLWGQAPSPWPFARVAWVDTHAHARTHTTYT